MPRRTFHTPQEIEVALADKRKRARDEIRLLKRELTIKSRKADAHAKIELGGLWLAYLQLNSITDLAQAKRIMRRVNCAKTREGEHYLTNLVKQDKDDRSAERRTQDIVTSEEKRKKVRGRR